MLMYTYYIMLKRYSGRLYCFSPPVMLFTFIFELGAALYVVWRYKMSTTVRLVTIMLVALATFQLAEYMICGGLGLQAAEWSRLGYISITLLPAIGVHLLVTLAGKKAPLLISFAYTTMIMFALYFALTPGAINIHECRPNYAVFNMNNVSMTLYALYYYGWLLASVILAGIWSRKSKNPSAIYALGIGYLLFMIPTITVNLIQPETTAGIPSIMCGFAVLLAVMLVAFVLPKSSARSQRGRS